MEPFTTGPTLKLALAMANGLDLIRLHLQQVMAPVTKRKFMTEIQSGQVLIRVCIINWVTEGEGSLSVYFLSTP